MPCSPVLVAAMLGGGRLQSSTSVGPLWTPKCSIIEPLWGNAVGYHDDVIKWKHFSRYLPFFFRGGGGVGGGGGGEGGGSTVNGEFPSQRLLIGRFDVFFDLSPNKRLSKRSKRRSFETLSRPLWRHCNDPQKGLMMKGVFTCHDLVIKRWEVEESQAMIGYTKTILPSVWLITSSKAGNC